MLLELLISQYKENETVIKSMLNSIEIQQGINFNDINIIIANDGSDVILSKDFLESYSFNITYYTPNHLGMSGIRNFLLDHSTADYIMFCDADDMFYTSCALSHIIWKIREGEFDCLFPYYIQEFQVNNNYVYQANYGCEVHGKVLRRQYLLDNKIRWKEELLTHDSRYFFTLCENCTSKDRILYDSEPYYLWKYNPNSKTRSESGYFLSEFNYLTLSVNYLVEELLKRGLTEVAQQSFISYIGLVYFSYNSEKWQQEENKEKVDNNIKNFSIVFKKFKFLFTPEALIKHQDSFIYNRADIANRQTSLFLENITFKDWIAMIEKI